jgi:hypothetical protein
MEHFEERLDTWSPVFLTVLQLLVELAIALLVLFHDYGSKDTAVVVSLLIAAYGTIRAHIAGEGAVSAAYFQGLSKLIRENAAASGQGIADREPDVLETLSMRVIPYVGALIILHTVLASIAAI